MNKTLKILLIALGVIIVIAVVYFAVSSGGSKAPASSTGSGLVSETTGASPTAPNATAETQAVGNDLIAILQNLGTLTLDDRILLDPSFRSLQSISIQLSPRVDAGRVNPFAPIGAGLQNVIGSTSNNRPATSTSSGTPQTNNSTNPFFNPSDS